MEAPDLQKSLERHLETSRYTLDYYEATFKQLEEKSRNNVTLGTAIVGIGALIGKTETIVSKLHEGTLLILIAIFSLVIATFLLLYLHWTNIQVLRLRTVEMFSPDSLREKMPNSVYKSNPNYSLEEHLEKLIENYLNFASKVKIVVDEKSSTIENQSTIVGLMVLFIVIYIAFVLIASK